jgi:intracellular septation protein
MKNAQKPYFLLSFFPALAYWYLETYYTLEVALIGGIVLSIIEMYLEKRFTGHVHMISKLNLTLILILGGVSLIAKEGIFFKLQPTLTGLFLSSFLIFKKMKNQSLLLEMMREMNQKVIFPEEFFHKMEWHLSLFFLSFSFFMAWVALYKSTATWLFWKTGGFYMAFGGFLIVEMFYIMKFFRRLKK